MVRISGGKGIGRNHFKLIGRINGKIFLIKVLKDWAVRKEISISTTIA
jgi:hypothetical protein